MGGRGRGEVAVLLAATFLLGAAGARAADPDSDAPAVCAPPCPSGQVCVVDKCVPVGRQRQAPPRAPAPPPPSAPPPAATYMTQPAAAPPPATPAPAAQAPPPAPYAP